MSLDRQLTCDFKSYNVFLKIERLGAPRSNDQQSNQPPDIFNQSPSGCGRAVPKQMTRSRACACLPFEGDLTVHDGVLVSFSPSNATPFATWEIEDLLLLTDLQALVVIDHDIRWHALGEVPPIKQPSSLSRILGQSPVRLLQIHAIIVPAKLGQKLCRIAPDRRELGVRTTIAQAWDGVRRSSYLLHRLHVHVTCRSLPFRL